MGLLSSIPMIEKYATNRHKIKVCMQLNLVYLANQNTIESIELTREFEHK